MRPLIRFLRGVGLGTTENIFQSTEEKLFLALLKTWGFKQTKRMRAEFDSGKFYLRNTPKNEPGVVVYTLSGGPMIVFYKITGEFMEWC